LAVLESLYCDRDIDAYMFETVPLRATLGVDVDFIVQRLHAKGGKQVDLLLAEHLPVEARELDIL
jgi:hypothetical protein